MKWTPPTSTGEIEARKSEKEAGDSRVGGPSQANGVKAPKVKASKNFQG